MRGFNFRRLRDRLIENESLSLAMEVTTKCGLDPGAVWGAWGLAYLQVGKFKEARQKFSKFLKVSFVKRIVCSWFSKYIPCYCRCKTNTNMLNNKE